MKKTNIRFCGFGGQGIVLSGYIYGHAGVLDGFNALQTQSYGSESRGGACKSDVVISKGPIYELEVEEVDALVAMSQPAHDKYLCTLKKGGTLIVEKDLVVAEDQDGSSVYGIGATDIAFKDFGRKIMANMVMMGYLSAVIDLLSVDSIHDALKSAVPNGTEELNISAFTAGYALGQEHRSAS